MFVQSLRMTQRDWRAAELRFLLVALIVAVAALSSVGFFVDRMRAGLNRDANRLLGADLLINADQPISPAWRTEAQRRGLVLAETIVFPSMALAGEGDKARSQLASIKAVTPGYPLRGSLKVTRRIDTDTDGADAGSSTREIPQPGTVWVEPNLLSVLNVTV